MDVTCATCGEPWDTYHMRHDAVWDTPAGIEIINDKINAEEYEQRMTRDFTVKTRAAFKIPPYQPQYQGEQWEGILTPFWKAQFEADGWKLGSTVLNIISCPCCKGVSERFTAEQVAERVEARETVESLLGEDLDGLSATLEDLGLAEARS